MNEFRFRLRMGLISLLALVLCGAALAGTVRGRVTGHVKLIPEVYSAAAKPKAHRYAWREPSPTVRPEFRVLSANLSHDVCVAALASGAATEPQPTLIRVTGGQMIPTTIVVAPKTQLSFSNRDPFPHRIYQVGSDAWKPADLNAGSPPRAWTAPPTGVFEFRDELFPSVRLHVVVESGVVAIAYPGSDGAFSFDLPAGDYVLKAFFEGKPVGKPTSVPVKAKGLLKLKDPIDVGAGAK